MNVIITTIIVLIIIFGLTAIFGAPFVPTRRKWAKSALGLANLKATDTVIDLGSGTGIILKLAADQGAKAIGYEINPILLILSRLRLVRYGNKAQVKMTNFWKIDLPPETTVVYVFAVMRDEAKLIKYLETQAKKVNAKQIRVISFGLTLSGKKPIASADGANLYLF